MPRLGPAILCPLEPFNIEQILLQSFLLLLRLLLNF